VHTQRGLTDRRRAQRRIAPRLAAAAAVLALALTGCQSYGSAVDEPDDVAPGGGTPSGGTPGGGTDADAGAPLLQIEISGGFVMWGYDFSRVPELTVYADGRAIVQGPQITIYPGPALPNLQVEQLSEADLDALIDAARDAGLLAEPPVYGQPPIADAPSTFVRLTVDGQTYEHAANALGLVDGESTMGEGAVGAGDSGMTDDEVADRAALAAFVVRANELVGATGNGEAYEITGFGVMAEPAPEGSGTTADGIDVQVLPWPVEGVALADAAECVAVDGDEAAALVATLADANALTMFEQDGVTYTVWFRPLLPHESGCEGLG
jgi:hypothetical protein